MPKTKLHQEVFALTVSEGRLSNFASYRVQNQVTTCSSSPNEAIDTVLRQAEWEVLKGTVV
jgi:hypothetical protein